jgi:aspartate kinase
MSDIAVLKFGGTSVKSPQRLRHVASIVEASARKAKTIVVVSAMGDETDRLVSLAGQCADNAHSFKSEIDVLLATGEQVTISLLSIILQGLGLKVRSLTGAQAGIVTDGRHGNADISGIDCGSLKRKLEHYDVLVVAGFQGATAGGDITTLGRGGSDTSAVALAGALGADVCDIYTDVDGIYDRDPNKCQDAERYSTISYDKCLELALAGAQVIHPRAVKAANYWGTKVRVRSTFKPGDPGTLICSPALDNAKNDIRPTLSLVGGAADRLLSRLSYQRAGAQA